MGRFAFSKLTRSLVLLPPLALCCGSAASAASSPLARPAGPIARPALWVVADHDTIIYLFGTFHAHDGKSVWFTNAVKNAFDDSEELVLETVVPRDAEELRRIVENHRSRRQVSTPTGLDGAGTAMKAARSAGLSVSHGADTVLSKAAAAAGKPVEGLESFESQLQLYDRLPAGKPGAPQPQSNTATNAEATPDPAVAAAMRRMMLAWDRGDQAAFEALIGTVQTRSPTTYRLMFQQRNFEWAGWIARRLQEPGTVFVAVGTGHLVGYHSVQAQLALRGIRAARIN